MPNRPIRPVPGPDHAKAVRMMTDRVLVRLPDEDAERRSRGGLVIPATAATVSKRGRWGDVVAVGPNVRNVEAGDGVLLLPDAGIEVEIRGEEISWFASVRSTPSRRNARTPARGSTSRRPRSPGTRRPCPSAARRP